MPLALRKLYRVDKTSFDYIVEFDVDVPLCKTTPNSIDDPLLLRANIYRPKADGRYPVLVTCGPYGKDIPYAQFHAESFSLVNPKQKSPHSAWEVPDPGYWTANGYVVVRADERGTGNSPGKLDSLGPTVWEAFADLIEWCADQSWSNARVGLLGISYYAASQWSVAARQPRGLACMIPWEGAKLVKITFQISS
jgi:putative CocE/NonD family hydrolase